MSDAKRSVSGMIDAWIAREMAAQEETQAEAARAGSGLRGFAACGCTAFSSNGNSNFKSGSGFLLVGWGGVGGQDTP